MRKNDDLISRQDALSFLRNWERVKDYSWGERNIIKATINEIESLPSAQPDGWLEQNKDKILQAGMEGREIDFRIGGRLFAIREKAQ